jgi:hypothetical protein
MSRKLAVAVQLSIGVMVLGAVVSADTAEAQRGGRGGGARGGGMGASRGSMGGGMSRTPQIRTSSRANVSTRPAGGGGFNRPSGGDRVNNRPTGSGNRINSGNNINSGNRNTNINIDADGRHGYAGYGDYRYRPYAPVARAVVAGAVVGATARAVAGSYYPVLPAGCTNIYRETVSYYQCGSVWYQPTYVGTSIQYVVVTAP